MVHGMAADATPFLFWPVGTVTYHDALSRLLRALRSWAAVNGLQLGPSAAIGLDSDAGQLRIEEVWASYICCSGTVPGREVHRVLIHCLLGEWVCKRAFTLTLRGEHTWGFRT